MKHRALVVVNDSVESEQVDEARVAFAEAGWEATFEIAGDSEERTQIAREAARDGVDRVIAFGGDGTVRACVEGLVGSDTLLGVLPAGTGNLVARNLGIPEDLGEAIDIALGDSTRILDTGKANGEAFVVAAGAGLDAEVMENTDSDTKDRIGSLAYVLEGARHLNDPSFAARIVVNGSDIADGQWAMILVGNMGRLQGGIEIFPESAPDDGALEVLGISGDTAAERLAAGLEAVIGDGMGDHLVRATGSRVTLHLKDATRYEIDGDAKPATSEVDIEVQPRSLKVLAPAVAR